MHFLHQIAYLRKIFLHYALKLKNILKLLFISPKMNYDSDPSHS